MSLKEKFASFLFGRKPDAAETEEQPKPEKAVEEVSAAPSNAAPNPSLLEIPTEHPINRLYNQRQKEAGYLPAPRVCLDEDGVLPPDILKLDMQRLRTFLMSTCSARLKAVNGKGNGPRKKQQDEEAEDGPPPLDALPCFFLSANKLFAWVIVFPPARQGKELSREILRSALTDQGILYGVDEHLADHLAHDDKRYFNLFLIAKGKPAFDGKNGNIVDNFPRVIERVLEIDEYDQVDYTALNLIHNAEQGQEICHLIKPTEGEPGRTVLDQEVPAKSGKSVPLPKGRNTEISEDGTQLLASIAGHVEFTGRSFQVKPVLDIPGDVDFSTGDLNFLGDINIKGDVLGGFTVRAMGNVHVDGVVEAGSSVEAGGDLVVVKGILGDGTTTVQSQRSIFSKYIENATICVRENIQTDCIIGSSIYCGGEVLVQSGRGSILGGRIWAAHRIAARTVGSQSECKTSIALGGRPCADFERDAAQREVNALEMELEKLECQPESSLKSGLLGKTRIKLTAASLKLQQAKATLEAQAEVDDGEDKGRLECNIAYPGTKLIFGTETRRLHHEYRSCVATLVNNEIVIM